MAQVPAIQRRRAWERDGKHCVHCGVDVQLSKARIDHRRIVPIRPDNSLNNLFTLCPRCYFLRDLTIFERPRGTAIRDGIIPLDWGELMWHDLPA